jgi:CHAD domain-containing protein
MPTPSQPPPGIRVGDVREALRRQIGDAARVLRDPSLPDEAIHHARKELKRARSNLRLLREAVGRKAFERENAALRDASRPLSGVRDAKVLVKTIDDLIDAEKNAARRALLVKARGVLEQERLAARQTLQGSGEVARSAERLDEAWKRVNGWRLTGRERRVLERGVKRIYARARKALSRADAERSAESLHEWRKHVKYLGAALATLDAGEGRVPGRLMKRVDGLAERLGVDHDLVVLEVELARLHSRASHARTGIQSVIAERRAALQDKALKDAHSAFSRRPKAFLKHVRAA